MNIFVPVIEEQEEQRNNNGTSSYNSDAVEVIAGLYEGVSRLCQEKAHLQGLKDRDAVLSLLSIKDDNDDDGSPILSNKNSKGARGIKTTLVGASSSRRWKELFVAFGVGATTTTTTTTTNHNHHGKLFFSKAKAWWLDASTRTTMTSKSTQSFGGSPPSLSEIKEHAHAYASGFVPANDGWEMDCVEC